MAVTADPCLPEEDAWTRLQAYGERDKDHQWCDDDCRNGSNSNIDYPLQGPTQGVEWSLPDSSQRNAPNHVYSVIVAVNLQESRNEKELHPAARALPQLSGKIGFALVHKCENRHLGLVASQDSN
jgi:hypothetical protein